jgi:hypothetical protein
VSSQRVSLVRPAVRPELEATANVRLKALIPTTRMNLRSQIQCFNDLSVCVDDDAATTFSILINTIQLGARTSLVVLLLHWKKL